MLFRAARATLEIVEWMKSAALKYAALWKGGKEKTVVLIIFLTADRDWEH